MADYDSSLLQHTGHDYDALLAGWEKLSRNCVELTRVEGYPVITLQNKAAAGDPSDGVYISAGVHGDECAPVWALLEWAQENLDTFDRPLTLFPCLNPVGLIENTRRDQNGDDLNRMFEAAEHPVIGAWQESLGTQKFRLAINLHEDYDARGIYLYELPVGEFTPGDSLLSSCETIIPRDIRDEIDGSPFSNGLLSRGETVEELESIVEEELGGGYPEAIWLSLHHLDKENGCALTFETPSEFSLTDRIRTHRKFIDAAIDSIS